MTALTPKNHETIAPPSPLLLPTDRCDRCPQQAYVGLTRVGSPIELLFCNHHFGVHELALMQAGWEVYVDDRAFLLGTPGVSA